MKIQLDYISPLLSIFQPSTQCLQCYQYNCNSYKAGLTMTEKLNISGLKRDFFGSQVKVPSGTAAVLTNLSETHLSLQYLIFFVLISQNGFAAFQSAAKFPLRAQPSYCVYHFSHFVDQLFVTLSHLAGKCSPCLAVLGPGNDSITMEEEENGCQGTTSSCCHKNYVKNQFTLKLHSVMTFIFLSTI